jgi:hypothetical protein
MFGALIAERERLWIRLVPCVREGRDRLAKKTGTKTTVQEAREEQETAE